MNTEVVINYILASFKFGVPTRWEWHRHDRTRRNSERLYFYVML